MKAILTTLKLGLPAAFVLLLAGCITDPYQYRGGYGGQGYGGDYYYGRPSVEYRHHDYYGPYGYGYGYPYYGRSGWSFGVSYGYPYGYSRYGRYGYGYGGWPYYYRGYPSYPPIVVRPRPGTDPGQEPQPGSGGDDQGPAPWRDLARLRDLNPGPAILTEPQAPRIRQQYEERLQPQPEPEARMRAPRPMAAASGSPVRASRIERVRQAVRERDDEP